MLAATGDQALPRERLPAISVLIGLFIVGAVALTSVWSLPVKITGMVLAVGYAIMSIRTRMYPAPEMILYLGWVTWSLTGLVGARDPAFFFLTWTTVFQIWVLTWIISTYTVNRRTLSFTLGSFLVGALVVGSYSYVTGEYERAEASPDIRVGGLAMNANAFAWLMVLATITMAYFWMLPSRRPWLKYGTLIAGMMGAGVACILSASRTGLVGLMAFYPLWIWFCYRRVMLRRAGVFAAVVLGLIVGGYVFVTVLAQSGASERLLSMFGVLHGQHQRSVDIRISLVKEAWALFQRFPITGVGLGNFRLYSATGHVAHSEYAEVASTTGAPGFVLYFSIFIVLWLRAGKIARHARDDVALGTARLIRAVVVVVLLMSLGQISYYNKAAWIAFASFVGYTSAVWQDLRSRLPQPRGAIQPDGVLQGPFALGQAGTTQAAGTGPGDPGGGSG